MYGGHAASIRIPMNGTKLSKYKVFGALFISMHGCSYSFSSLVECSVAVIRNSKCKFRFLESIERPNDTK